MVVNISIRSNWALKGTPLKAEGAARLSAEIHLYVQLASAAGTTHSSSVTSHTLESSEIVSRKDDSLRCLI